MGHSFAFIPDSVHSNKGRNNDMDKCPYCSAETRPGDNFCLNCGNRLVPSTPSPQQAQPVLGDTTLPTAEDWVPPAPQAPAQGSSWSDPDLLTIASTSAEPATLRADAPAPTAQAVMNKIETPAHLILRADTGEVLQDYTLDKLEMSIGRAPNSDILLSKDKLTSRRHATILYENGQYSIRDERSANGTFVNSQQLDERSTRALHDGDHIGIGEHELIFQEPTSSAVDIESMPTMTMNAATPLPAGDEFQSVSLEAPDITRASSPPHLAVDMEQIIAQMFDAGEIYYKSRQYEEALAIYERVIQFDAGNAGAYGNKGNVLRKRGKYKNALDA